MVTPFNIFGVQKKGWESLGKALPPNPRAANTKSLLQLFPGLQGGCCRCLADGA